MKHISLLALFAVAAVGTAAIATTSLAKEGQTETTATEKPAAAYTEIDAAKLQEWLGKENVVVLDARSDDEFAKGHIPGATHLRPNDITEEKLASLAPGKEASLVFYCGNRQCPASAKAAYKAAEAGYSNLFKYTDGMEDWQAKGLPVETN